MTIAVTDLLAQARARGIKLTADDGRLRYDAPKGALTDTLKDALREHKAEILSFLESAREAVERRREPIRRVSRDEPLRASYAQKRLWFMHQLAPESPFYNVPAAPRFAGPLDVPRLEGSLDRLVARHEALRTTFFFDGELFQRVGPAESVALPRVDLEALDESGRDSESRRVANEASRRPFDLTRGPMLHAVLVRRHAEDHILALTLHHSVSDGWSMGVLMRDLVASYRDRRLAPLAVQYADYAAWQRERLQGDVLAMHVDAWRTRLQGLVPLTFPPDRARPATPSYRGRRVWLDVADSVAAGLRKLSSERGVTLFTTLLAAFKVLLHRYTDERDIAVGSPIAGRESSELEELIGFFVNSLVLRTTISPDESFMELLTRVADVTHDAYVHQELPFEKLVEEVAPERDPTQNPLFHIVFALQPTPAVPEGVFWGWAETSATRFDLEAHVVEDEGKLRLAFVYATDLFESSTIERLQHHYASLLHAVVRTPGTPVGALPLVAPDERRAVHSLGATATRDPEPETEPIHRIFESQARRTPNEVAIRLDGRNMTYRELDRRANHLAHRILEAGLVLDAPVAVLAEREPSTLVALLAILKAGGAYVPLDPSYPAARIDSMLGEVDAKVVLGRTHRIEAWGEGQSEKPPAVASSPDALAYIMFTSGSTGIPKGSAIPHRGVTRLVRGADYVTLTERDVVLQLAPLSFDASTFEIWGALLNGATLALFADSKPFPDAIARAIRQHGVTTLWLTATLFNEMVDREPAALASVRQVLAGGEALSPPHVRRALDAMASDATLVNGYGPTENTTFTACHVMTRASKLPRSVPIGRPVHGTYVYLLDRFGEPVPPGVPGELFAGGDGVARGYWSRPEMTAERFVPDPFARKPGARLYRTGDRCRWRADGTLEFLGREDAQVKLRGFRIELAEIDAALTALPQVAEAATLIREDDPGDRKLYAYVVPEVRSESKTALDEAHVTEWRALFDRTYESPGSDPATDFTGWHSSYTGQALPETEMSEWLDRTVERIRSCRPRRILEIGCGTGLLLHRLAPSAERYVATDFSSEVIARLSNRERHGAVLLQQEACDFTGLGLDTGAFDTVLLNSVTQYLPGADYLKRVISGALRCLAPGGRIFIGDVRNLDLLNVFHASVEKAHAPPNVSRAELSQRVLHAMEQEAELVLSPDFFVSMAESLPRLTAVDVLVKRGRFPNELNRFRYDVFLHADLPVATMEQRWLDWSDDVVSVDGLETRLAGAEGSLAVRGILDGRLSSPVGIVEWLSDATARGETGERGEGGEGVDLELLFQAAERHGFRLELTYSYTGGAGYVDASFRRPSAESQVFFPRSRSRSSSSRGPTTPALANDPLRTKATRALTPVLREQIAKCVPQYMVPHGFVVVDALPRDANGKLDRQALPRPHRRRAALLGEYVAPRSRSEKTLARIWAELLRVDRVGATDNFFELGGDSILGIQVVARAREEGLSLRAADIFECQSVGELAAAARPEKPRSGEDGPVAGELPLTPIQQWFFAQDLCEPDHFNQAMFLKLDRPVTPATLRRVATALMTHHDVLRSRFRLGDAGSRQHILGHEDVAAAAAASVATFDVSDLEPKSRRSVVAAAAEELQRSLSLRDGPVVRWGLFQTGPDEPARLLVIIHHLVVDAVSWRIVLEDLERLLTGRELPRKTTSYKTWAEHVDRIPTPAEASMETASGPRLPRDHEGTNVSEGASVVRTYLDESDVPALGTESVESALLSALVTAFSPWTGEHELPVTLETHGRDKVPDGMDLSRTVGWFTELTPTLLDGEGGKPTSRRPEVGFSYFGRFDTRHDGAFSPSEESPGAIQSPRNERFHLIDVTARIESGRLRTDWHFNTRVHERSTIEAVASRFVEALRSAPSFARVERPLDDYALAPMQRGILFHTLYEENEGAVYVQQYGIVLDELEPTLFRDAWQRVVNRHAVLRTSIVGTEDKTPRQRVHPAAALEVTEHDARHLSRAERETFIQDFLARDRKRGIDLGKAPLMRLALIQIEGRRFECVWTFHHIVLDGWSVPLVLDEVFRFYRALRRGEPLELPTPRPYRDYIAWLAEQDPSKLERFWRDRLRGVSPKTPLGLLRGGAAKAHAKQSDDYGEVRLDLSADTTERLRALSSRHRVTLNTTLLGAWALLLGRYSGDADVVFGTTVAGRPPELAEVASMVGLFINTLATRVPAPESGPLGAWLQELQRIQAAQTEFQHAPLWQVQQWCGLPQGTPLFDSLFVFENYPLVGADLPKDLRLRSRPSIERSGYPLAVAVSARESISIRLYFKKSELEDALVVRLRSHLASVVGALARSPEPEPELEEVSPLTDAERHEVLVGRNDTDHPYPVDRPVHELVATQSRMRPDALAVAAGSERLTYAELNERANRLAHHLIRLGVGPETNAGVCLHRGVDLLVAKLAVLKAGGAYVPLAPEYPRSRLGFILEDAGVPVLVTTDGLASRLPDFDGKVVTLDSQWQLIEEESADDPSVSVPIDVLAYVIYTSGSTGRPKGVEVSHRSLLNLVHWHRARYDVEPTDRATQIASVGFDACVWEIWPHLTAGASVHVPDEETRGEPARLWDYLSREGITICFLPTPLAEAALEVALPDRLALRLLLTGGDRLTRGLTRELPFELVNHYGLTETAVVATSGVVSRQSPPPIGRAIANTKSYVLNASLDPVPVGVAGELFIGGDSLARGYLNQPALTAERFVVDRFSGEPGSRLYRTGDVARLLPDGEIEFLGRNDEQVKIRGHRIELAEVEIALTKHPAVKEAVILCRQDGSDDRRLVAYVVTEHETPTPVGLRAFLDETLPHYMVPAQFVFLESIPLSANGKVDRGALPPPHAQRTRAEGPRNRVERTLARIWSDVLGVGEPGPGPDDSFFELGGDSISSIQIVARAREAGLALSAKHLFEHPTLGELAETVTQRAVPPRAEETVLEGDVPLSPIQAWFFDQDFPEPHHFNQALVLKLREPISPGSLWKATRAVMKRHDALRLRFVHDADGNGWRQSLDARALDVPFAQIDLSELTGEDRARALSAATNALQKSLNLTEGPLLRVALFGSGSGSPADARLFLAVHHLMVDAFSWGILLSDLERAARGEPLPEKTTSFVRWAHALARAESGGLDVDPGAQQGETFPDVAKLPRDREGANTIASADSVRVALDPQETQALTRELPGTHGMELADVLLAALGEGFSSWTGERRLLVTFEGHGRDDAREDIDLSRSVGWFTVMSPLLIDSSEARDILASVRRVREQRSQFPSSQVPLPVLEQAPQVSFNYLGRMGALAYRSALFETSAERLGPTRSPKGPRLHEIEIIGQILEDRASFDVIYSRNLHERGTIERLADGFVAALRSLIRQGRESGGSYKPTDFELAELNQRQLDALMKRRAKKKRS